MLVGLLLLGALARAPAAATPKHVLFFLIDDLGYADVGYHGNAVGSAVLTPTIDTLSRSGVRLENYCKSPVPASSIMSTRSLHQVAHSWVWLVSLQICPGQPPITRALHPRRVSPHA